MRRHRLGWFALGAFLLQIGVAAAQDSLNALEEELKEAKQQHLDATSQVMTNFFSQVDAAMVSPDAAVALYQQAGGVLPPPTPVVTEHVDETATEKEKRLAQDQANTSRLGTILQLHCGLMHFAALFVTMPDQKGLQGNWIAWLKSAAQIYPQLAPPQTNTDQNQDQDQAQKPHHHRQPQATFNPTELKGKSMHDSIISHYLAFKSWGDKEQGLWAVQDIPRLYRTNILDPLRVTPTADTLAAWDAYIAMENADEPDTERWNQVDYPPLQFDRACDDYTMAPDTEKLEGLVNLIKANPTYSKVDEWISRVQDFLADYRAHHGGAPALAQTPATNAASATPTADPNVTVTTQHQGDMTIITTHTNSVANPVVPH